MAFCPGLNVLNNLKMSYYHILTNHCPMLTCQSYIDRFSSYFLYVITYRNIGVCLSLITSADGSRKSSSCTKLSEARQIDLQTSTKATLIIYQYSVIASTCIKYCLHKVVPCSLTMVNHIWIEDISAILEKNKILT